MVYQPTRPRIETIEGLRDWVETELDTIALQFAESQSLELRTTHQAPTRPRNGMIVHADGTDWDPGYGEGLYVYQDGWQVLAPYSYAAWTPTLTFATPGDLAVTYALRFGSYMKIGKFVNAQFRVETSAFTWTTAANGLTLTGLPFTVQEVTSGSGASYRGNSLEWEGITKANYTHIDAVAVQATTTITFAASGSGQVIAAINAADMPSGGTIRLRGNVTYRTAS